MSSLAPCLAILGTGSDVGKSIVVTALCRIFANLGLRVAPFKAQNMSNNSFVTRDGGEMGRAQIVQAQAARVEPTVDMNPVLLKPCTDVGAQVILHGRSLGNRHAADYFSDTHFLFGKAAESLDRLRQQFDLIVLEGAGSCAEVNLRPRDFVNFRMAHHAGAKVVLVADIDRGGVFAQIVGTLDVIPPEDRQAVAGFLINRFRGDASLFADGMTYLEQRTQLPSLGLVPYFRHIEIDSEDGLPLEILVDPPEGPAPGQVNIAVLRLPHISNFTDFDPLRREPGVRLSYLARPRSLEGYSLVILPGSKNVRSDLDWLRGTDWERPLASYLQSGGELAGICGGFQMLGRVIHDPQGLEGAAGSAPGLGLLDGETTLQPDKILTRSAGIWEANGQTIEGYEIHMGVTTVAPGLKPALRVTSRNGSSVDDVDGAMSANGKVWGCYLHGLFDSTGFRKSFLQRLAPSLVMDTEPLAESIEDFRDRQYNLLADHFRAHLDMDRLLAIAGIHARNA